MNSQNKKIVLFSVMGLSPAVLTETIYALAFAKKPQIPNQIVVLTTKDGKGKLLDELFAKKNELKNKSVWELLRETISKKHNLQNKLMFDNEDIIVFRERNTNIAESKYLSDIYSPEHNLIVADTIIENLRRFTENSDTKIIASIAGGRKTMSALLFSAMTLIGRTSDKIVHVLVNPPYDDNKTEPKFYFPHPAFLKPKMPKPNITLAEIPFVALREKFNINLLPCSYSSLVSSYSQNNKSSKAQLFLDEKNRILEVDGIKIPLHHKEWHVLKFLLSIQKENLGELSQKEAAYKFFEYVKTHQIPKFTTDSKSMVEQFKVSLCLLRKACRKAGTLWAPGLRSNSLKLPPFVILKKKTTF